MSTQNKASAFRLITEQALEDQLEESLSKKSRDELMAEVGERGRASLEKGRALIRDVQKAAAFRAIATEAQDDGSRAKAALEKGRQLLADNTQKPPSNVIPIGTKRPQYLAAGLGSVVTLVAVAACFLIYMNTSGPGPSGSFTGAPPPSDQPLTHAQRLAFEGMSRCAIHDYEQCLKLTNDAIKEDRMVDVNWYELQQARRIAQLEIDKKQEGGAPK
jgi:hypothetical protein